MNPYLADALIKLGTYPEWNVVEQYVREEYIEPLTEKILTEGVDILETEISRIKRTIWLAMIALPRTAAEEKEEPDESGN